MSGQGIVKSNAGWIIAVVVSIVVAICMILFIIHYDYNVTFKDGSQISCDRYSDGDCGVSLYDCGPDKDRDFECVTNVEVNSVNGWSNYEKWFGKCTCYYGGGETSVGHLFIDGIRNNCSPLGGQTVYVDGYVEQHYLIKEDC